jgi:hypothetical protein
MVSPETKSSVYHPFSKLVVPIPLFIRLPRIILPTLPLSVFPFRGFRVFRGPSLSLYGVSILKRTRCHAFLDDDFFELFFPKILLRIQQVGSFLTAYALLIAIAVFIGFLIAGQRQRRGLADPGGEL